MREVESTEKPIAKKAKKKQMKEFCPDRPMGPFSQFLMEQSEKKDFVAIREHEQSLAENVFSFCKRKDTTPIANEKNMLMNVFRDRDITAIDLKIFVMIYSFSCYQGECTITDRRFSEACCSTFQQVSASIKKLKDKRFIGEGVTYSEHSESGVQRTLFCKI